MAKVLVIRKMVALTPATHEKLERLRYLVIREVGYIPSYDQLINAILDSIDMAKTEELFLLCSKEAKNNELQV